MSSERNARVVLEVEIDCDAAPLAGVVRGGPGTPDATFVGWMGLTRAIELALERCRGNGGPAPQA